MKKHTWLIVLPVFIFSLLLSGSQMRENPINNTEADSDLPDFQMYDTEGKLVNLKDFKGKRVFVNVWATWCGPCVREMPSIQELYEGLEGEDIAVVMIAVDQEFSKATRFFERKKYTMPLYEWGENLPEILNTGSIPTTLVFDSEGKLAFKHVGGKNYASKKFKKFLLNDIK